MPVMERPEDKKFVAEVDAWLRRIRSGDSAAEEELLAAVREFFHPIAVSKLNKLPTVDRQEDASDGLQVLTLKLYQRVRAGKLEAEQLLPWCRKVLANHLIDRLRQYQARNSAGSLQAGLAPPGESGIAAGPGPDPADSGPSPSSAAGRKEQMERLAGAISSLPNLEQAIVIARYLEGREHAEIARSFALSVKMVQRYLRRAEKRLGDLLG